MAEDVHALFDDYAARFARGERPDARAYLARAGAGAGELGRLIDGYLARAPAPPPSEDAVALARAWVQGQPPLQELRVRRGLERADVVTRLIELLGLDMAKRDKVAWYYGDLESGLLEPRRVDQRVWAALAETLRARVEDLLAWRPRPAPPLAAPASHPAEPTAAVPAPAAAPPVAAPPVVAPPVAAPPAAAPPMAAPADDVDNLFGSPDRR